MASSSSIDGGTKRVSWMSRLTSAKVYCRSVYLGLGDMDKGMEWMERGIEERDPIHILALKCEPAYDPVRSRPAFQAQLRKMNPVP